MPAATFHYRARAADGRIRTGVITAEDPRSAARQLTHQGLAPISVGTGEKTSLGFRLPSFQGNARDVLFFTQELSTLLNSGVPLDRERIDLVLEEAAQLGEKRLALLDRFGG